MTGLNTKPNLARPDELYGRLIALHEGLSPNESLKTWSRLVLILANHIGDEAVMAAAIGLARPPLNPPQLPAAPDGSAQSSATPPSETAS